MLNVKKEAWRMFAGLGFVVMLYFFIAYFSMTAWQVVLMFIGLSLGFSGFLYWRKKQPFSFKAFLKNVIVIVCFVYGFRLIHKFAGRWAFVLTIIIIVIYILTSRWKQYIEVKQHIETMIWGKPLQEFIKAGEKPKRGGKR
jgi:hypothetical protein